MLRSALILFSLTALPLQAQDIIINKPGKSVMIVDNPPLTRNLKKEFSGFKRSTEFFGAFVVNREEDLFGEARGMHSLKVARQDAMGICRAGSKKPSACKEYSYAIPRDYNAKARGVTMNAGAQKAYTGRFKREQETGKFGAFAISPDGYDFGYSWGLNSAASAREQAKLECQSALNASMADTPARIRDALSLSRRSTCKVIAVTSR